jgi:hypothetical protein
MPIAKTIEAPEWVDTFIYRYGESHRPDSWREFTDFSAYAESALVLGNLRQNRFHQWTNRCR